MHLVAVRTTVFGTVALVWGLGTWLLTGDGNSAGLILSGLGGATVTGTGAFIWVRFVTSGMLKLIDQQSEAIDQRDSRIQALEELLMGRTP